MVLIAFNASSSEPESDIGVIASINALPADVLGIGPELFGKLPRNIKRVLIARKPGYEGDSP